MGDGGTPREHETDRQQELEDEVSAPYWAHGGIRGRRREALMVLVRLLQWKLDNMETAYLVKSYDMRNAFATGNAEALRSTIG